MITADRMREIDARILGPSSRYVAITVNGTLWHAGLRAYAGSKIAGLTLCGRWGEMDHDRDDVPLAASVLSTEAHYDPETGDVLGAQPTECLACRAKIEKEAND